MGKMLAGNTVRSAGAWAVGLQMVTGFYGGGSNLPVSTTAGIITFQGDYDGSPTTYGTIEVGSNSLAVTRGLMEFKVKSTAGSNIGGLALYGTNAGVNVGIGVTDPHSKLGRSPATASLESRIVVE